MRLSIDFNPAHTNGAGEHQPFMVVDGFGLLLDLPPCSLVDPSITSVEWGPAGVASARQEGGRIIRRDGSWQTFWTLDPLRPCLAAYDKKRAELAGGAT